MAIRGGALSNHVRDAFQFAQPGLVRLEADQHHSTLDSGRWMTKIRDVGPRFGRLRPQLRDWCLSRDSNPDGMQLSLHWPEECQSSTSASSATEAGLAHREVRELPPKVATSKLKVGRTKPPRFVGHLPLVPDAFRRRRGWRAEPMHASPGHCRMTPRSTRHWTGLAKRPGATGLTRSPSW